MTRIRSARAAEAILFPFSILSQKEFCDRFLNVRFIVWDHCLKHDGAAQSPGAGRRAWNLREPRNVDARIVGGLTEICPG